MCRHKHKPHDAASLPLCATVCQVGELQRAAAEMAEAQCRMKTYFAEEAKASIEEVYSRWATFLSQADAAIANINEDRRKAKARK
jgi:hypothetical protein